MKILVRGTNWIGDAIMSVPAMKELRRIFPDDRITLHTRTWADGLFREAEFIDELVTYDKRSTIRDVYDNAQFLKEDGYDLAVLLPNSFESALTSFLTRIPRRIGYNKDARGLLLTDPVPVPEWKNRRHEVYYYLNLIAEVEKRVLGRNTVSDVEPDTHLELSGEAKEQARELLSTHGVDLSRPVVVLGAGSTNSLEKRWPARDFAALADRLAASFQNNVLLVGSKDEIGVGRSVAEAARTDLYDLTGKTTLEEAVGILAIADLMISNDMGLAHVAPAVGTATIAVFGPTDPKTTRPFGPEAIVVRSDKSTWPSVDEVFSAAANVLSHEYNASIEN